MASKSASAAKDMASKGVAAAKKTSDDLGVTSTAKAATDALGVTD